ncbi:MAG: hypothetical protein LBS99_01125 [Clostridiales bacterium]|jgi:hypothetical protein|nr:hypothetical protein [Clostridiales bacterium]
MPNIQVIKLQDTEKISKAMENGKPFYLKNGKTKCKVINTEAEELEQAKQELCALLQEAEDCKETMSLEEFEILRIAREADIRRQYEKI